jgi:hypothetical protein
LKDGRQTIRQKRKGGEYVASRKSILAEVIHISFLEIVGIFSMVSAICVIAKTIVEIIDRVKK